MKNEDKPLLFQSFFLSFLYTGYNTAEITMAKTITDEMCIAAAYELAKCAEDKGISEEYIIPSMDEWEVYPREATAVGMKAIEQGVARIMMSREELYKKAETMIKLAREETKSLMKGGFIKMPKKQEAK